MDAFTTAYLEVALWSSNDDEGEPLDSTYEIEDIAQDSIAAATADCAAFRQACGYLLEGWTDEQAGHDFWLTRNGHGAGFWDRGALGSDRRKRGEALSTACGHGSNFPPVDPYVGDDGKLYGFGCAA